MIFLARMFAPPQLRGNLDFMKAIEAPAAPVITLEPLERETLRRLRAEWELAATRTELAKARLEYAVATLGRSRGVEGNLTIDFELGLLLTNKHEE